MTPQRNPVTAKAAEQFFGRVLIIGSGLVGGSIGQAIRHAGAAGLVIAYDTEPRNCAAALGRGLIDTAATDLDAVLPEADLVIFAIPVGQVGPVLRRARALVRPGSLVVDTGSIKTQFADEARAHLSADQLRHCIPCHPIAGHVSSGPMLAGADLMRGHTMVLTPLPTTDPTALDRIVAFWRAIGFVTRMMSAEDHDATYALLSHLPHLLSFALLHQVGEEADEVERVRALKGNAFDKMTQFAASGPGMWSDILVGNRDHVLRAMAGLRHSLNVIEAAIATGSAEEVERLLRRIQRRGTAAAMPPAGA